MKTAIKLTEYPEKVIERGILIRCKGKYPYEEVVDFLVCESQSENCYQLIVASGYKAGLTFCYLPQESIPDGMRFGCSTKWLIENWTKWGYGDCPVESVWLIENSTPDYPNDNSNEYKLLEKKKLNICDAFIRRIEYSSKGIIISFIDWQEKKRKLNFIGAVFMKTSDPIESEFELLELPILENENMIEEIDNYKKFHLVSPWDNKVIMEIIAENAIIE